MPWCDPCGRFFNPNTLRPDGSCEVCGTVIASRSERKALAAGKQLPDSEEPSGTPWHFKLLIGSATIYLGWRAVQGLEWLYHHV